MGTHVTRSVAFEHLHRLHFPRTESRDHSTRASPQSRPQGHSLRLRPCCRPHSRLYLGKTTKPNLVACVAGPKTRQCQSYKHLMKCNTGPGRSTCSAVFFSQIGRSVKLLFHSLRLHAFCCMKAWRNPVAFRLPRAYVESKSAPWSQRDRPARAA